ncbi:MAG: DNA-directed RNA polymerase subunit omega [Actinomycetes bacterium]
MSTFSERPQKPGGSMAQGRLTLTDPPIEDLLDKVDSKFTLVALGALRARQVNAYYNSLGEGLGRVVPPQVASVSGKPLSIAFEEIAASKATYVRVDPELLAAEAALEGAHAALEVAEGSPVALEGAQPQVEGSAADPAPAQVFEEAENAAEPVEDEGPAAS